MVITGRGVIRVVVVIMGRVVIMGVIMGLVVIIVVILVMITMILGMVRIMVVIMMVITVIIRLEIIMFVNTDSYHDFRLGGGVDVVAGSVSND